MNSRWDYVISEDNYSRVLFRVYPSRTTIHRFNDKPPKTWKKVFKVYYSWAIIHQYKNEDGTIDPKDSTTLFYMYCDECSDVVNLHSIIRWVMKEQKEYNYPTIGQPAVDWRIEIKKYKHDEFYCFSVFNNCIGNGYRFTLTRKETKKFSDWLERMNERALIRCGCSV